MQHKVFAVFAEYQPTRQEVCFLVVAADDGKVGWPLLKLFGKTLWSDFAPSRLLLVGPAHGREEGFVDMFGPEDCLRPLKEKLNTNG
jgi:hypothetical protein